MYLLMVIGLISSMILGAATDCPTDKSQLAPVRLRNDLLCGYEKSLRPVIAHQNATRVFLRLILKYFSYNQDASSFVVDSWITMFWKDEHLKWNPTDYESIKSAHLSSDEIWMPDFSVYNRNDQSGDPAAIGLITCVVSFTGQVVCVPPSRQISLCVADLTHYPFDTQNCTIRFGSWVHSGEEIDFRLSANPVSTEDLVPNGEWQLVNTKVVKHPGKFKCCPNNTYPSLNFSFLIKRLSGAHAASVILPALAIVAITLTSLWIDAANNDRFILCCVNLIVGFLYSQHVSWLVPLHGKKMPLIQQFARDSLVLVAFALVHSVVVRKLVTKMTPPPSCISAIVDIVTSCKPGRMIFLNDSFLKAVANSKGYEDGETIIKNSEVEESTKASEQWSVFASILDRLCFIAYCIVYTIMFIAFAP